MIRTPAAYANWVDGNWVDEDSRVVPVQAALSQDPYAPQRGRDGQRWPWKAHLLSTNYVTPSLGFNVPGARVIMGVRRYLKANVDHSKVLRVQGFESSVPGYTWTGLSELQRIVANQ